MDILVYIFVTVGNECKVLSLTFNKCAIYELHKRYRSNGTLHSSLQSTKQPLQRYLALAMWSAVPKIYTRMFITKSAHENSIWHTSVEHIVLLEYLYVLGKLSAILFLTQMSRVAHPK